MGGRRLPDGSLTFVTEDVPVQRDMVPPGAQVVGIPCRGDWESMPEMCFSWQSHAHLGPAGLSHVLRMRPYSSWYMICDHDTYIQTDNLARYLHNTILRSLFVWGTRRKWLGHWSLAMVKFVASPPCAFCGHNLSVARSMKRSTVGLLF